MPAADIQLLRTTQPLAALRRAALNRLLTTCYVHALPAQTTLIQERQAAESAYVLITGTVELSAHHKSRSTILALRRAPAALCFLAAIDRLSPLATITTCEASRVLFLPAAPLRAIVDDDAAFARAVISHSHRITRDYVMELKNQKLRTGAERLIAWLLRHAPPRQTAFELPYQKSRIAARLGMSPEHLARNFAAIAVHGIRLQASRVSIGKPENLGHFSDPAIDDNQL
jgi:CRP/FNR family transcriptional regulator, transcriptional activator FtrB